MSAKQNASPTNNPLLHVKLRPPRLHSGAIQRDELFARLDGGLTRKLTVISAPTGYGKTTLVSAWIASRKFSSAWVTLDENDNDPSRFWTYICSALRTFHSAVGKSTLSTLTSHQPSSLQTLLTPLINDLTQIKERSVLVLEDYHAIRSAEIQEGISFIIQHLPESLHLVLITRTDPDLPLAILRVRDELVEINAGDLRFNQEETEAFLRGTVPADFPPSTVTTLLQKTGGWAAGLRLAVLSMQNKKNVPDIENLIQSFSGSDRYVADYLIKEVFESQPEVIQSFLLKTCFFKRLTGSLCDAITGTNGSASILEQLERDNLFIEQLEHGTDRIWYRYNSLFAESIQFVAKQRLDEAGVSTLFENASGWYEYHGLYDEAIETALSAKLFERALTLIEKFIGIHDFHEMQTLSRWLENIPRQNIFVHPAICFTNAQIILYTTDRFAPATAARIEPFLSTAESIWRKEEDAPRLGQLLSFRGNVLWWQGDFQKAFEYARQSLEILPDHDVFWRGVSLLNVSYEALTAGRILEAQDHALQARALLGASQNLFGVLAATQILAEDFHWQGELQQAEQLNQQIIIEAVGEESMLDDQGLASLNLAHIAYERNELDESGQFARRALELGEQRANELLQVPASIRLAHIQAAKGELSQARKFLKLLEVNIQNPAALREIQGAQALLSIRGDDVSGLDWWLKIISDENGKVLHMQKEREAFTLARLKTAQGKANEAVNLLNAWKTDAAQHGRVRSQVEALCLEALAYQADANLSNAAASLTEALTIGHAKGFRRLFLDEGPRMAALLQATLPSLPNRSLGLFAGTLLHSFSPEATAHLTTSSSTLQIEALSPQEVRVLRLIVAGLSNAEIAQELVISTNTVKTHGKSIYRKLNITSRDEARAVARELKLL